MMIDIKRILCPIDFSEFSRRALDHAVALARRYSADVEVLHVFASGSAATAVGSYGGPFVLEPVVLPPAEHERLRAEVLRFAEERSGDDVRLHAIIGEGGIIDEILRRAGELPADLVVLGTHGRSGFQRLMLGSVTEKILRKAPCPVLTVPPLATGTAPSGPVLFKRILCPVDFSDASIRALQYAMSLAGEAAAHLNVVHVMEFPAEHDALEFQVAHYDHYRDEYCRKARAQMDDVIPDSVRDFCTVQENVPAGKPYREILHLAAEQQADLIVMGVTGRGAVDVMLFGSTTNHVVRQATCPVLTVRA